MYAPTLFVFFLSEFVLNQTDAQTFPLFTSDRVSQRCRLPSFDDTLVKWLIQRNSARIACTPLSQVESQLCKFSVFPCQRTIDNCVTDLRRGNNYPKTIDPLHVCGNAANLEEKNKRNVHFCKKKPYRSALRIGCILTDVQGVSRVLYDRFLLEQ